MSEVEGLVEWLRAQIDLDEAHAKKDLEDREAGPEPYRPDFGPLEDYLAAWHYWRAVRRDARLTGAEADVQLAVQIERVEQWPGRATRP